MSQEHIFNKQNIINLLIVIFIDFIVIVGTIIIVKNGNDKAIILMFFNYLILVLVNIVFWLIFSLLKNPIKRIYKVTMIGLIALFVPTLMVLSKIN
jgi:hypothetical protein